MRKTIHDDIVSLLRLIIKKERKQIKERSVLNEMAMNGRFLFIRLFEQSTVARSWFLPLTKHNDSSI